MRETVKVKGALKRSDLVSKIIFALMFTVLLAFVLSLVAPMFWALMTSLKSRSNFVNDPVGWPTKLMFVNYKTVVQYFFVRISGNRAVMFPRLALNSLLYALGGSFFYSAAVCVTSYATAKFDYKFSKLLHGIVIVTMILPIVGSLPSEIKIAKALGLYDKIYGMWVMKTSFLGLFFLVFYATFKSLPKDFSEAAYVDGAGNFRVLWSIILPLVRNAFFTIMLIKFIELWNDYQTPLVYMPNIPTLAYGTFMFESNTVPEVSSEPVKMAGSMIVLLPVVVLFLLFHERLIGNISMGGLKE